MSRGSLLLAAAALQAAGACTTDIRGQPGTAGAVATYQGAGSGGAATYALASRVGLVSGLSPGKVFADAAPLLTALDAHLQARGFAKLAEIDPESPPATPPSADLLVSVTALDEPGSKAGYWEAFAGHSSPADLGVPGFVFTASWEWLPMPIAGGSLLVEIADVRARVGGAGGSAGSLPLVWVALANAVAPAAGYGSVEVLEALDRAFAQSPALRAP